MDYKKIHEDSLNIAKRLVAEDKISREYAEKMFPELAESEDERIRKAIGYAIGQSTHSDGTLINGVSSEEALAWLEKQGEQKETLCDKCKKEQPSHSCQDITALGRCALEKQSEQKPAELPKGEDYGIDGLYAAINILQKTLGEVDGYQSDDGILEHECAIEAVNRLYKQKHEWSEEDEESILEICNYLDRIVREDEDNQATQLCVQELKDWLKSIRPQNTWKPSEEQISVIEAVINNRSFQRRHLDSLYADLKKLRKE